MPLCPWELGRSWPSCKESPEKHGFGGAQQEEGAARAPGGPCLPEGLICPFSLRLSGAGTAGGASATVGSLAVLAPGPFLCTPTEDRGPTSHAQLLGFLAVHGDEVGGLAWLPPDTPTSFLDGARTCP